MALAGIRSILVATMAFGVVVPASAQERVDLAPYAMLRSLQFVQDSVVLGDHSAAEMQRFMLGTIDQRLRTADPSVFQDPRNVDAALIYAMSGGNPATLEYLASRDISGNFDNRVADALRKYLSGKGTLVAKSLAEMASDYRDQKIGPYLALVSGNVTVPKSPKEALVFYDWARLTAPGTIVEEAALRRSVSIAIDADMVHEGLAYSRKYARRFVHSPYASQFADFFVQLIVKHFDEIGEEDMDATLAFMDVDRRREVFLRIARMAAIAGDNDLARLVSAKAEALSGNPNQTPDELARLYGGLSNVSTADVVSAMKSISDIPEENLSPRDRALRQAAKAVAEQVLSMPVSASLAQDETPSMIESQPAQLPAQSVDEPARSVASAEKPKPASAGKLDPTFRTFVDGGRSKLDAIDELLKKGDASK